MKLGLRETKAGQQRPQKLVYEEEFPDREGDFPSMVAELDQGRWLRGSRACHRSTGTGVWIPRAHVSGKYDSPAVIPASESIDEGPGASCLVRLAVLASSGSG